MRAGREPVSHESKLRTMSVVYSICCFPHYSRYNASGSIPVFVVVGSPIYSMFLVADPTQCVGPPMLTSMSAFYFTRLASPTLGDVPPAALQNKGLYGPIDF